MEWLWNNPIADMQGPQFLLLYGFVAALMVAACAVATRLVDWTGKMPPPPLPAAPDPYEIAYLRGGENEVARTAVFALMRGGHLRVKQQGKKALIERSGAHPPTGTLGRVERRVYEWFDYPRESGEVFKRGGLAAKLKRTCDDYELRLQRDKLLTPPEIDDRAWGVRLAGLAVVAGLGAYKLFVALSNGRSNVLFLILLGGVAVVVLYKLCRTPRVSRRGRAHLERLQTAFDRLKGAGSTLTETARAVREPADEYGRPAGAGGLDPVLLTLGVFGGAALMGADRDSYALAFNRSANASSASSSSSSCGSGCGSSDSSSGGGDGGGGGCGGGCGGCGGD